jgi:eukaryotic-like serine/threonine-protein kinase
MPLDPGTHVGPYEIGKALGAGGMGEVYRARDTRLGRDVAIKILPSQFSADPVRKQRFELEAKAISNLNHPNICVLYDVGHHEGMDYLVMECLEGESLATRLERGALTPEQVLRYGAQVADAIDKAHRSGVLHRDIKPGNIVLTATGAKLVDFGLAKPQPELMNVQTTGPTPLQAKPLTGEGSVVGTFQYMSPEQIEGKELDRRSDIFSLGAVLYEMITGKRAFTGNSQLSIASMILEREPEPVSAIRPLTPPSLDRVIRRCLAKDPENRWQTGRDLGIELTWLRESGSQSGAPAIKRGRRSRAKLAWAAAALTGAAALLFAFAWWENNRKSEASIPLYAGIAPPEGASFMHSNGGSLAVSPDGTRVAAVITDEDGKRNLWLRAFSNEKWKILENTDDVSGPFWSPDGKWIGFAAHGQLNKILADGGPRTALCEVETLRGASWSEDGDILFAPSVNSQLFLISASGGTPRPITHLNQDKHEDSHRWPFFLPHSRKFLFFSRGPVSATYLGSLDSGDVQSILKNDSNAMYAEPGDLLYVKDHVLTAQAFDKKRLETTGEPVAMAQNVVSYGQVQHGGFSASQTGVLVFETGAAAETRQLMWLDKTGRVTSTVGHEAAIQDLSLSPDGTKIAASLTDTHTAAENVWIIDAIRGAQTPLTLESAFAANPVWSPDSKRIIYASNRIGSVHAFVIPANGLGEPKIVTDPQSYDIPASWSPDGRFLLHFRGPPMGKGEYWVTPLSSESGARKIMESKGLFSAPRISPDGKWLLFASNQSGRPEVFVSEFPVVNAKWQVSLDGGNDVRWSHDGKEMFFLALNGKLMGATFSAKSSEPEIGKPQALFDTGLHELSFGTYDVSRDGQFLISRRVHDASSRALSLIMNWPAALTKKGE